jgi:low affinity Fe/Cu permease
MPNRFETISEAVTMWTGSTAAFITALTIILLWSALGPVFGYSNTWQLVINTGPTIATS